MLTVNGSHVSSMMGVAKAETTERMLRWASSERANTSLFVASNQSFTYLEIKSSGAKVPRHVASNHGHYWHCSVR